MASRGSAPAPRKTPPAPLRKGAVPGRGQVPSRPPTSVTGGAVPGRGAVPGKGPAPTKAPSASTPRPQTKPPAKNA